MKKRFSSLLLRLLPSNRGDGRWAFRSSIAADVLKLTAYYLPADSRRYYDRTGRPIEKQTKKTTEIKWIYFSAPFFFERF